MKPIIGVIGGAGVAATNSLLRIIENTITEGGAIRDCEHPEMIIYQATQVPSRSMYYEGRGESFIPGYIDIAKKLIAAGATVLCMNCNTAHTAFEEISSAVDVPFINLIERTAREINMRHWHSPGLLVSDGIRKMHVYDTYIERSCSAVVPVYPDIQGQKMVTAAICNMKNTKRDLPHSHCESPVYLVNRVIDDLKNDCDGFVLGCTDLHGCASGDKIIDTTALLAKAIIDFWRNGTV